MSFGPIQSWSCDQLSANFFLMKPYGWAFICPWCPLVALPKRVQIRYTIIRESCWLGQARPHSSLLNPSCPCSLGRGGEEGGLLLLLSAWLLTSRGPPGDRRLPAEKMSKGQYQGGKEGRGRAQPTFFCLSCLKLVTF